MPKNKCELAVVILAAGQGKRMSAAYPDRPKVLVQIGGKAFIVRILESIKESGVSRRVILVVGHMAEAIKQALGDIYEYVEQKERLGTGHAVAETKKILNGTCENVMVLYGDHPFVKPETLRLLKKTHLASGAQLSMLTASPKDFKGWRATFADFGHIIRNERGEIIKLVEKKDATSVELAVKEVNLGMYVFNSEWLWPHIAKLEKKNAQGEYYLTDLIKMAAAEKSKLMAITVDPKEGIGFNTPEQLAEGEKLL